MSRSSCCDPRQKQDFFVPNSTAYDLKYPGTPPRSSHGLSACDIPGYPYAHSPIRGRLHGPAPIFEGTTRIRLQKQLCAACTLKVKLQKLGLQTEA